jgi:ABC-type polar amino acid transport system ATPase subunit
VPTVLEFAGVSKAFGGLRPLRIAELRVGAGERAALLGFDQPMAEVFVNLATGATLPDEGQVTQFGRPTSAIADSADWLAAVDRFGIVSDRAVVLAQMTAVQNLAMPFTLDIEPPPAAERARAEAIAREVGLPEAAWERPLFELEAAAALRVRLGRAVALDPEILLLEHATATVARGLAGEIGAVVRAVAERRRIAVVSVGADEAFARALGGRVVALDPATGGLKPRGGWFRAIRR